MPVLIVLHGALSAAEHHERANYHLSPTRALPQVLIQSGRFGTYAILVKSRLGHCQQCLRLSWLRLHWLGFGLHHGVAACRLVLIILTATEG